MIVSATLIISCSETSEPSGGFTGAENEVRLMTLNPGHFHAGLVHKYDYDQIDSNVHIYAPDGEELESHMSLIERFNKREVSPTHWTPHIYRGEDYLERMLEEKPGNVMIVSGNNARKIDYIHQAVQQGINVLADKPMVIHPDDFHLLKEAMDAADEQGLLVNDIMTERYNIANIMQKELSKVPELFGEIEKGSPDNPAIVKESVHFFYKTVAGEPLIRPAWFFDVTQQGEAIADVSTHLVDQILWQAFPEEPIDYRNSEDDVEVISSRVWSTDLTPAQFEQATNKKEYPDYLLPNVTDDSILQVTANGEFSFKVRGVHGRVLAGWGYENPNGGDTHYSVMRGTLANLIIKQDEEQEFTATLYVEPTDNSNKEKFESILDKALVSLSDKYPGLYAESSDYGLEIKIPDEFQEGHEDHFTRVTEQYLDYLKNEKIQEWELTNLLTKYYITTRAYELSR